MTFCSCPFFSFITPINHNRPIKELYNLFTTMAPVEYQSAPVPAHDLKKTAAPLHIFPDGLKTTGQHEPIYDDLIPFSDFPKEITGPTVWKAEDYRDASEKWTHRFTPEQIAELSEASDRFITSGTPLTGISKVLLTHLYYTPYAVT